MARKLGEILIDKGLVTPDRLNEILKQQEISGKPLGQLLLDTATITSEDLKKVYLEQISEKYASIISKRNLVLLLGNVDDLTNLLLDKKTSKTLWNKWLEAHKKDNVINKRTEKTFTSINQYLRNCELGQPGAEFVPLMFTDKELFIAINPSSSLDMIFTDNLYNFFSLDSVAIAIYVVTDEEYSQLVDVYRNISEAKDVYNAIVSDAEAIERGKKVIEISSTMRVDLPRKGIDPEPKDARQLAFAMLAYVLSIPNVTDLHLFHTSNGVYFEYRADGELIIEEERALSPEMGKQVANVIMQLAGMNYTKRTPQDGQLEINFKPTGDTVQHYFVRVASAHSVHSFDAIDLYLRFLSSKNFDTSLEQLGYLPWQVQMLQEAAEKPYGIILITGPTGSGKSTTLYAMISHLLKRDDKLNILTVEDPVEYRLDGVKQYQIDEKALNEADRITFPSMLRAAMRMDPDVMLIGEIRDRETLDIALNAALTGHLVFATLHANTAILAIARMLNMGAPADILASVLNVVIGQRLLRKASGKGRQAVAEILDVSFRLKGDIGKRKEEIDLYRTAWEEGFKTMEEVAQEYVSLGIISQSEVERVIGDEYRLLREQFISEQSQTPVQTKPKASVQTQAQSQIQPQTQVQPTVQTKPQTTVQEQPQIQIPVQTQAQVIQQTKPQILEEDDEDPFSF